MTLSEYSPKTRKPTPKFVCGSTTLSMAPPKGRFGNSRVETKYITVRNRLTPRAASTRLPRKGISDETRARRPGWTVPWILPSRKKGARLWVITPVYLDVEPFFVLRERLLEVVAQHLTLRGTRLQFVVVDDSGGLDLEVRRLRSLPDVLLVEPPFNLGHQRAIVYGIRCIAPEISDHDVVVTLDADGEDRPE